MVATIAELLSEYLPSDFPQPVGPWRGEDDVDPRWQRETLRRSERNGLIVIDRTDPKNWRWAFTLKATERRKAMGL